MAKYIVAEGVLHETALKGLRSVKRSVAALAGSDEAPVETDDVESVFPEPLRSFLLLEKGFTAWLASRQRAHPAQRRLRHGDGGGSAV